MPPQPVQHAYEVFQLALERRNTIITHIDFEAGKDYLKPWEIRELSKFCTACFCNLHHGDNDHLVQTNRQVFE